MTIRGVLRAVFGFLLETIGPVIDWCALLGLFFYLHLFPKGGGQPVLLIPGLFSSDTCLRSLAAILRRQGYRVETWGCGRNLARHRGAMAAVSKRVRKMYRETGMPVIVIGHSLGGLYALDAAHSCKAKRVHSVITLGSPIHVDPSAVAPWTRALLAYISGESVESHVQNPRLERVRSLPPGIPVTTIAATYDWVVGTKVCAYRGVDAQAHYTHIEVFGTHNSLVAGFAATVVVLDRLSHGGREKWRSFDSCRYMSSESSGTLFAQRPRI